jgi:hypothetical protein
VIGLSLGQIFSLLKASSVHTLTPMAKKPRKPMRQRASAASRREYQVFLSHATADKWLATTICEKIQALGASTFRDDRDIRGGDDIPDEVCQQIKQSQEVVVLLTPASVGREWILIEVGAAWAWRKRIVVILEHVDTSPIPTIIRSKKAIKLTDVDIYLREVSLRAKEYGNAKR